MVPWFEEGDVKRLRKRLQFSNFVIRRVYKSISIPLINNKFDNLI